MSANAVSQAVVQAAQLLLRGTLTDDGWFQHIRYENGKANVNAILILSEILYWYRPTEIKDEETGKLIGYKKKFKADKLQKSYRALADRFGITKRQAKTACDHLVKLELITIEFRTIETDKGKLNNVMFVEPDIEKIKAISCLYNVEEHMVEDELIELDEKQQQIEELKQQVKELKKQNAVLKKKSAAPQEPQMNEFKKLPKEAIKLSLLLIDRIKQNFPQQPVPDKTINDSNKKLLNWCKEMERLHRLGPPGGNHGYSWEEILNILKWSQESNFWKGNILSVGKLREKVVTLTAQMQRNSSTPKEDLSKEILELGKQLQDELDGGDHE